MSPLYGQAPYIRHATRTIRGKKWKPIRERHTPSREMCWRIGWAWMECGRTDAKWKDFCPPVRPNMLRETYGKADPIRQAVLYMRMCHNSRVHTNLFVHGVRQTSIQIRQVLYPSPAHGIPNAWPKANDERIWLMKYGVENRGGNCEF